MAYLSGFLLCRIVPEIELENQVQVSLLSSFNYGMLGAQAEKTVLAAANRHEQAGLRFILAKTLKEATMTIAVPASPPEQGQLVSVRSRQWIVTNVCPSTLPAPALKPTFNGPQNLLTLASVEDDGLGEELQVIWEIEPGAQVIDKVALPEPTDFDPPDKLDAFLDAVRWRAASTADVKNAQAWTCWLRKSSMTYKRRWSSPR